MKRQDILNIARQQLYAALPEAASFAVSETLKSDGFQRWADRVERERPHGIIAWWRRTFGRPFARGLSEERSRELEELVRKELAKRGR